MVDGKTSFHFKDQVMTELLLLKTYDVKLPGKPQVVPAGVNDKVAERLLQRLDPQFLGVNVPFSVRADGNCLFRALSQALYGTENHHLQIRLLTALEMASFPKFYDTTASGYQDLIRHEEIRPDR